MIISKCNGTELNKRKRERTKLVKSMSLINKNKKKDKGEVKRLLLDNSMKN